MLRNVVHPFIVKMHFAFQTDAKLYIGMDFVNGGLLILVGSRPVPCDLESNFPTIPI